MKKLQARGGNESKSTQSNLGEAKGSLYFQADIMRPPASFPAFRLLEDTAMKQCATGQKEETA